MRVATILGTRPEIIRLSRIIPLLDAACEHSVIHTGQNHDPRLSDLFFAELGLRAPDHDLAVRGADMAEQVGAILSRIGAVLQRLRPDRVLILGDTNSALAAIIAKRMGIPVFHMEAGNRCFDDRVPEEVNRRIIDHASDVLLPYTERSRQNLLREGIAGQRVFVTGNPIGEILAANEVRIAASTALATLGLTPGQYLLATLHRAENVDDPARLASLLAGLGAAAQELDAPVIISTHPRTRRRLEDGAFRPDPLLRFVEPFGFFDFVALERAARCVLTDSGTVQEECAILRVPNVTLRDTTERPETLECGANILSGADPEAIRRAARLVAAAGTGWTVPPEYTVPNVAATVARIVLGHVAGLAA